MSVLVVQSGTPSGNSSGVSSQTFSLTGVTAGNSLVVQFNCESQNQNDAIVFPAGWTVKQAFTPTGYSSAVIAVLNNAPAGTNSVTVYYASGTSGGYYYGLMSEVSPLAASPGDLYYTATGTGGTLTPTSGGTATSQADEIVFSVISPDLNVLAGTVSQTTPSGYTSIYNENDANSYQTGASAYKVLTTTQAISAAWTGLTTDSQGWVALIWSLKDAASAPPVNLAGTSLQTAANTGSLSQGILLSSTSQQQASATGTITDALSLAAISAQEASAFAALSLGNALSGTSAAQSAALASLSRGVLLSSTSQQQASAIGTLVSQVLLTGVGQQAASAFGVLTDTLSLTAISAQEAVAFAALSIGNPLSGVSGAQSAALASLLVAKGFSGITQAGPTASANLTVTAGIVVALTGVSFAQNSAFGALTGLNALVGVSAQSQVAYGQRSVTMQGVSSAVQSAYAALSILLGTSGISSAEASARAILTVFAAGSGATLMSTATPSWVMTYDSLTQAVLQSLERSDTSTQNYVPTAITMAEFEIAQQIKTLGQLEVADTTLSPLNPILAKPARWRKTVSMTLVANGMKQPVLLRKLEYLSAYAQSVSAPGTPLFYADYDYDHWMFAPTPDIAYAIEALVYTRLEPLSSSNQTNWLTQNAPNAMLFGALKQMMLFLKDDQRLAVFKGMFDEAMSTLKTEDTLRVGDRSAVAVDS